MKVLIAVASKHGSTREIAQALSAELQAADIAVDLLDLAADEAGKDIGGYDAVILGSAIYAGNWRSEAKEFAQQHQDQLLRVPVWLFSSGPLGAENPQPHDAPEKLALAMGPVRVRAHHVFAGKLDPQRIGFGERLLATAVKAPEGDFRDWAAIKAWAQEIAAALSVAAAS